MANDSAANNPPPIVKGRGEEKSQNSERNGPGNQFSARTQRRKKRDGPYTPIGSNCISTPGKKRSTNSKDGQHEIERKGGKGEGDTRRRRRSIVNLNEIYTSRS